MSATYRNALSVGTRLDGDKYQIGDVLGAGGFAVVYRATHCLLGTEHAIKEYLPTEVAHREGATVHPLNSKVVGDFQSGLGQFLQEARMLVKLMEFGGHPNIVRCTDFFQGNGTAYLVMAFEEEFGGEISDEQAQKMSTVGDVVEFLDS